MSEYSAESVESRTNMLSLYSQVVSAIGFVVMGIGAILLIISLILEFSGDMSELSMAEVAGTVMIIVWGLALTATGSALAALRTIAVNCARMADPEIDEE